MAFDCVPDILLVEEYARPSLAGEVSSNAPAGSYMFVLIVLS